MSTIRFFLFKALTVTCLFLLSYLQNFGTQYYYPVSPSSASASPSTVCLNGNVTLTFAYNTDNCGGGPQNGAAFTASLYQNSVNSNIGGIQISTGSQVTATAATGTITYTLPQPTSGTIYYYEVISYAGGGCTSATGFTTSVIAVTVNTASSGLTYSNPGPLTYCTGNVITANTATVSGGGTFTYSVSPTLPAGLSLNSATGAITGTPITASGATTYTITADNGCGSTTKNLVISIVNSLAGLTYSTPGPVTYCTGNAMSVNNPFLTVTGGTVSYSVTPSLPAGLSINGSSGVISGTPSSITPATNYTVTASNVCSSTSQTINITTIAGVSGLAYSSSGPLTYCTGSAITSNTVSAISGGGTITYAVSPSLPAGLMLNMTNGTISGAPASSSTATNYIITASNSCSSATATLNITTNTTVSGLSYTNTAPTYCTANAITTNSVSAITGSGTITYSVSPALPSGLSLNAANGTISGTPTAASGATAYTITASNGCSSTTKTINITVITGVSGLSYSVAGPVTYCTGSVITSNTVSSITGGGTITYSVSPALPAGLSISSSTGTISGTPSSASAAANYTVAASNGCSSTTKIINITVITGVSGLTYSVAGPVTYCTGSVVSSNTVSSITGGGSITYSVSPALPAGLSISSSTGAISGTPSSATAAANYTITASNSCSSANAVINITTVASLSGLTYLFAGPVTYCTGSVITSNTVSSITGGGIITYSVSPALPAGLSISSSTGAISGTPSSASAAANYTITASNGCSSTTKIINITVITGVSGLSYSVAGPVTYCTGSVITSNTVSSITGGGTITYSVSPALPAGLSISSSTGTISGTPSSATAAANYTITASNSCSSANAVINITIDSPPSITAINNGPVCAGSTLTLSATTVSGASYAWTGPNSFSSAGQNPAFIYVGAEAGNYTLVVTGMGGCSATAYTTVVSSAVPGQWRGGFSPNWNNADNWCSSTLPTISTNVTIPSSAANMPIVTDNQYSNNLVINTGASLNINTGGTLQIAGSIINNGIFDGSAGALEMSGSAAQTIPANTFNNNSLYDLVINNSSGVTLGGPLDIYNSLTYSGTGMSLTTNDYLALKSTATATAWLGDMTGNTISGKVTVERYLAAKTAWRFLSIPTNTSQTIQQSWQEGATNAASNPAPGFGTQITGPAGTAAGFDSYSPGPAMKTYNTATSAWAAVNNTSSTNIKNTIGYFIFVRGDRTATSGSPAASPTILRTKGNLYVGDQPAIAIAARKFLSIGNPYASAVDMRNITKAGVKDFFYTWDPQLAGGSGYGGYQTFSNDGSGNYVVTPGGGSYGASGGISNYIQSGQAFFVEGSSSGGSLTFKEAAKTTANSLVSTATALPLPQLRVNLYTVKADNTTYISDGFVINYNDSFSNLVDDMDALKSTNGAENLSVKTGNKLLVIERRQTISNQDTVFFNLANMSLKTYRFEILADRIYQPGLTGYLIDNYLHTRTALNIDGNTLVDFSVTNVSGSYAANRFQVVFSQSGTLPVTFASIKAYLQYADVPVEWKVGNESNIKQYEVERSTDGNVFTTISIILPTANNGGPSTYQWVDKNPSQGFNYYRVKSVDIDGKYSYSEIVKVQTDLHVPEAITIFPNPIENGIIHLQFVNQPQGMYRIRIINQLGEAVFSRQINHGSASNHISVTTDKFLPHGVYKVEVSMPGGVQKLIKVVF